jgi:hypothetical protein
VDAGAGAGDRVTRADAACAAGAFAGSDGGAGGTERGGALALAAAGAGADAGGGDTRGAVALTGAAGGVVSAGRAAGADLGIARAGAGAAACATLAAGTVFTVPHALHLPRLPAIWASTLNCLPQPAHANSIVMLNFVTED